jgi:hypothetical protein
MRICCPRMSARARLSAAAVAHVIVLEARKHDLAEIAPPTELRDMESEVEQHLKLPTEKKEALAEPLFRRLAVFTAETLARKST